MSGYATFIQRLRSSLGRIATSVVGSAAKAMTSHVGNPESVWGPDWRETLADGIATGVRPQHAGHTWCTHDAAMHCRDAEGPRHV